MPKWIKKLEKLCDIKIIGFNIKKNIDFTDIKIICKNGDIYEVSLNGYWYNTEKLAYEIYYKLKGATNE